MKYLIFSADYFDNCLKNEFGAQVCPIGSIFSKTLVNEIMEWNEEYRKIIPMPPSEKQSLSLKIAELDEQGIKLVEKIINEFGEPVKIKYFSEGGAFFYF